MEHSAKVYLERMSAEELEVFLHRCVESDQGEGYGYILPLVREILLQKQDAQE